MRTFNIITTICLLSVFNLTYSQTIINDDLKLSNNPFVCKYVNNFIDIIEKSGGKSDYIFVINVFHYSKEDSSIGFAIGYPKMFSMFKDIYPIGYFMCGNTMILIRSNIYKDLREVLDYSNIDSLVDIEINKKYNKDLYCLGTSTYYLVERHDNKIKSIRLSDLEIQKEYKYFQTEIDINEFNEQNVIKYENIDSLKQSLPPVFRNQ